MNVATALDIYATEHGPQVVDAKRMAICLKQAGLFFGRLTVADITPATCKRFVRESGRSDQTDRRVLAVLNAAISHCWKNGHITRPVHVWLPKPGRPRQDWLTRDEVARLLRAARDGRARSRDHLSLIILIAVYTGRRIGAITELRWSRVDLENGWIDFDVPGRQETNKRRGLCKIHPKLLGHLKRARRRATEFDYVVRYAGKPVRDARIGLRRACQRAELRPITPHVFRHTCVSWLMQAGIDSARIGSYVGMTPKMVTEIYGHLDPNWQDDVLAAFSRFGARDGAS